MNNIINNDVLSYIIDFLPKIDYLKYYSDTVQSDILSISNILLVSKYFKTCYLTNNYTKKENNYKEFFKFLANSYELRNICAEFRRIEKKKKKNVQK